MMKKYVLSAVLSLFSLVAYGSSDEAQTKLESEVARVIKVFPFDEIHNEDLDLFFVKPERSIYQNDEYIRVSAESLTSDYLKNEARADKTYKQKKIVITGSVASIKSGIGDVPYVVLKTTKPFNAPQLTFIKSQEDVAIDLDKGAKVQFICIGNGVIIGSPVLKECRTVLSEKISIFNGDKEYRKKLQLKAAQAYFATNELKSCGKEVTISCLEKSLKDFKPTPEQEAIITKISEIETFTIS